MEDIQDGIKVSIQDGVTEDPDIPEAFTRLTGSGTALGYLSTKIGTPEIKATLGTQTGTPKTATIGATLATVIT